MTTVVKKIGTASFISKSKNGWYTLSVPASENSAGYKTWAAKTSRNISDCELHFEKLTSTFPEKKL